MLEPYPRMSKLPRLRKKIKNMLSVELFQNFLRSLISKEKKADLFYLINESIERHKTSFSEFF